MTDLLTFERIPNDQLVIGGVYRIHARNFYVGIFTGEGFIGARDKFNEVYLFEEYLQEMPGEDHRMFGTALGYERIGTEVMDEHVVYIDFPTAWIETIQSYDTRDPAGTLVRQSALALLVAAERLYDKARTLDGAIRQAGLELVQASKYKWDMKLIPKEETNA